MGTDFTLFKYRRNNSEEVIDNKVNNSRWGQLMNIQQLVSRKYGVELPLMEMHQDCCTDHALEHMGAKQNNPPSDEMFMQYVELAEAAVSMIKEMNPDLDDLTLEELNKIMQHEFTEEQLSDMKKDIKLIAKHISDGFCMYYLA